MVMFDSYVKLPEGIKNRRTAPSTNELLKGLASTMGQYDKTDIAHMFSDVF